jgi:hypothetical protein
MSAYVSVAGHEFTEERAKSVIAGYALGTRQTQFQRKRGCETITRAPIEVHRWGYKTYDCVLSSKGPDCEPVDYLVAGGLNGRIDVGAVAALQVAAPPALNELAKIEEEVTFWELREDRLIDIPGEECPERHLWLAWCHMITMPEIGVALTHKVLHHKRPRLFPLADGQTIKALGQGEAWQTIHRDLNRNAEPFEQLESWFGHLVNNQDGLVGLSRLRLHDILLWCRMMPREEKEAVRLGEKLV